MFGSVGFMLHGNVCVGVWQTLMIVRLGQEQAAMALKEPHVVELAITGRPMKGWAMVKAEGIETDEQLRAWVERVVEFVETLPPKQAGGSDPDACTPSLRSGVPPATEATSNNKE
jgi:hypothetical protein